MQQRSEPIAGILTEELPTLRAAPGEAPLVAYLARPEAGDRCPGVVIIHELFGLNENMRDIARRFAGEGYAALAVDLFSGTHRRLCIMRVMTELVLRPLKSQAIAELRLAVDWLRQYPAVDADRIGAIGFCFGGGYALALACVEPRLGASSVFYGTNIRLLKAVANACPIVGSYPGKDFTARSGRRLDRALDRFDVPHDIRIYPGAKHAFFNDTVDSYDSEAAADSWRRTITFFEEHLKSATAG